MALPMLMSLLSGCVSMRPTMTSFTLDYNRVVADARNRMILLNIVRAAYREPTYYTALSQIEGSLNLQGSVNGTITDLVGGGDTGLSPSVSGSISNAPTFTVVPLTSDEFSKGMLTPIDGDTIRLFLSQGWRSSMIAPLVIQKIQCGYGDTVFADIDNQPSKYDDRFNIATISRILLQDGRADTQNPYRLSVTPDRALSVVTGGALDKFDIAQEDKSGSPTTTGLLVSPKPTTSLSATVPDSIKQLCRDALQGREGETAAVRSMASGTHAPPVTERTDSLTFSTKGSHALVADRKASPEDKSFINLVFRSPDEIVYYLGELLRLDLRTGKVTAKIPEVRGAGAQPADQLTLFEVQKNASGPSAVAIEHHGARWSIPVSDPEKGGAEDGAGRTMQVIALLNDLISSQTSASDVARMPSSVRVR